MYGISLIESQRKPPSFFFLAHTITCLLLDEGDVDAILMGKKTQYPDAAIRLTEQMAQEFINDLFSTLRERMLDLQYCKVVFVGGGAILLKRQIETSGKVGTPFFVPKINANADGYEYLYRIETAGRLWYGREKRTRAVYAALLLFPVPYLPAAKSL